MLTDLWRWFEDEKNIRAAYWLIQSDDVVIDVGCHVGAYTLPALKAGASVYAVDPNTEYTDALRLQAVDCDSKLIIVNKAIAEPGGYSAEFREALNKTLHHHELHAVEGADFITLDSLVETYNIQRLDWIKIDVEGAELSVLKSGINTLTKFHPKLLIEDHTMVYSFVRDMQIGKQCVDLAGDLGYTIEVVDYDGAGISAARTFQFCTVNR